MRTDALSSLCLCGVVTGLVLLLFPSGAAAEAGKRAVCLCYLAQTLRLLLVALGGNGG